MAIRDQVSSQQTFRVNTLKARAKSDTKGGGEAPPGVCLRPIRHALSWNGFLFFQPASVDDYVPHFSFHECRFLESFGIRNCLEKRVEALFHGRIAATWLV